MTQEQVVRTVLGAVLLLLGIYFGWRIRSSVALRDAHRLTQFYERLLMADLIEQHTYMDPPATIYVALCSTFAYVGQTSKELETRIYQHGRGTSGFDRVYSRNPDQWQWFVLETVPMTYRYAAERAWIERYVALKYTLMNGNNGTDDGLAWEITDAETITDTGSRGPGRSLLQSVAQMVGMQQR
jgi:hypothetical protein